jgi:dienelactone hydrolase
MTLPIATTEYAESVARFGQAWGYKGIAGVPGDFSRRTFHWVDLCDADEAELLANFRAVPSGVEPTTESWTRYFSAIAEQHLATAAAAERRGDRVAAKGAFLKAALNFEIAMFALLNQPKGPHIEQAYRRQVEAFLQAGNYFSPPLEVVKIPYAGLELTAYVRIPKASEKPPVVLLTGGADAWKSHASLHAQQDAFTAAGFATLITDLPGTGDCPVVREPGCHRYFRAVLDYIQADPRLDGARIGAHMRSFGGYFAVALAMTVGRHEVQAVVSLAPNLHTGHVLRGNPEFSLLNQGLLQPRPEQPELLVIHSLPDEPSIQDVALMQQQGIVMDTLIYAQDYHTAMLNGREHLNFSIEWIKNRIARVHAQADVRQPAGIR